MALAPRTPDGGSGWRGASFGSAFFCQNRPGMYRVVRAPPTPPDNAVARVAPSRSREWLLPRVPWPGATRPLCARHRCSGPISCTLRWIAWLWATSWLRCPGISARSPSPFSPRIADCAASGLCADQGLTCVRPGADEALGLDGDMMRDCSITERRRRGRSGPRCQWRARVRFACPQRCISRMQPIIPRDRWRRS